MNLRMSAALCGVFVVLGIGAAQAQSGIASVYGYDGQKTANGERANSYGFTAAHRTLPFGSKVRVTNKRNGKSVVVRINDRGPFVRGRMLDLSKGAAGRIGMIGSGHASVCVQKV